MQFTQFSRITTRQAIDTRNAIIRGVSVIAQGETQDHGLTVDGVTLEQVYSAASKLPGGLKVRFNRPTRGKDASVLSAAGFLKDFRRGGDCLRADLHLFRTGAETPKILEMARIIPEHFGLSVVFNGENEERNGKKFARCSEICACDLSDDPDANPAGALSTNHTPVAPNKSLVKGSPEWREFYRMKRECGRVELNRKFSRL